MTNMTPVTRETIEKAPYPNLLGLRLVELAQDYAKVTVSIRPDHANFLGTTDGALVVSLADYSLASASNGSGQTRVGVQSNINFIAATPLEGELTAEARPVHIGRTLSVFEARVTDVTGKIVAKATSTVMSRPDKSSSSK